MKLLDGNILGMFFQLYPHGGEYPSKAYDITESLVIREDDISLVTQKNGDIPPGHDHGYGLYHHDCRFLSSYIIRLNGMMLTNILSSDENEYASTVIMTNRSFKDRRGAAVEKDTIVVRRDRVIPGVLDETIRVNNYNRYEVKTDILLEFKCDFYDVFTVRGITKGTDGTYSTPLFLILLAEYVDWTGDSGIMSGLEECIRGAIEWLDEYSDPGGMGFVSYSGRSSRGL